MKGTQEELKNVPGDFSFMVCSSGLQRKGQESRR